MRPKVAFFLPLCNPMVTLGGRKGYWMTTEEEAQDSKNDPIIREIIELERSYFFERRNVKTERQRKLREIIERHTKPGSDTDDS